MDNTWLMGIVNCELAKRSNALLNNKYDANNNPKQLNYEEYWVQPFFKEAFVIWFGTIICATALLNPITLVEL
jgi:hypothetical protein